MPIFVEGSNPAVSEIIADVRALLLDADKTRWDDDFLILAVNAAELEIVTLRPDAGVGLDTILLEPGSEQSIDGFAVMDVVGQFAPDGATAARIPTRLTTEQLNVMLPGRATHTPSATVVAWAYDTRDQGRFIVYPPQPAVDTGYLTVKQASFPPGVTTADDATFLPRDFKPQIVEYCLYHCFKRDAEYADHAQRSAMHYQQFLTLLGQSGDSAVRIAQRSEGAS